MASAYVVKTLYNATPSTGQVIQFSGPKWYTSILARTGTFWVKPHPPGDAVPGSVTTPVPAANAVADGWARLGAGESCSFGVESQTTKGESGQPDDLKPDQILFLEVWCEGNGDLVVVAH